MTSPPSSFSFFFFNDTATTEIYTLSLHDALPISAPERRRPRSHPHPAFSHQCPADETRSEEHTSELQSLTNLVCRLLLEKKKTRQTKNHTQTIKTSNNTPPTANITTEQPTQRLTE